MCATSFVFLAFKTWSVPDLDQFFDFAGSGAAPALMQPEGAQRGLVACDEQHDRRLGIVDVLVPLARRHGEGVEVFPVEALAADQRVAEAAALERGDEQARGLPLRARALARAQHLREERHGFEQWAAVDRV